MSVPSAGARSALRGHPTRWDEDAGKWRYEDDGTPLPGYGGELRPCTECGSEHEMHESDPCLGDLPGVDNACCGHGDPTPTCASPRVSCWRGSRCVLPTDMIGRRRRAL